MTGLHRKFVLIPIAASAAMLFGSACATEPVMVTTNVRDVMQQGINAATLVVWDVGNNAMSDDGGIDPALMTEDSWTRLEDAARLMVENADQMANAEAIYAGTASEADSAPGTVTMADVQGFIDADPEGFRAAASLLSDHAAQIGAAARARDAQAAGDLVAQLDQVCEVCHSQYWYPEQDVLASR
jgi:hypothetical protein